MLWACLSGNGLVIMEDRRIHRNHMIALSGGIDGLLDGLKVMNEVCRLPSARIMVLNHRQLIA